jgi:hypothetical protein
MMSIHWSLNFPHSLPETKTVTLKNMTQKAEIYSELLGFWTLSIFWYSKNPENTAFRQLDLFPF